MKECTVCGNLTANKCGKCGRAWYCSRDCQRQDWKTHKRNCKPYEIKESDGRGLGLFATCNIEIGDLIVREDPILYFEGPEPSYDQFKDVYEELSRDERGRILSLTGADQDTEEWRKGFQIFNTNCIKVDHNSHDSALYETISRINHSCCPNVVWSYVLGQKKTKEVRAVAKIGKGEEIVASYVLGMGSLLAPCITRAQRRVKLLIMRRFECQCVLCTSTDGEEEASREKIKELDDTILECAPRGALQQAATAAFKKIGLIKSCGGLNSELPFAYMELYELIIAAKVYGRNINYRRIGLSANPEVYREKSLELGKLFKLDCYKNAYNIHVKKIKTKYGVKRELWE